MFCLFITLDGDNDVTMLHVLQAQIGLVIKRQKIKIFYIICKCVAQNVGFKERKNFLIYTLFQFTAVLVFECCQGSCSVYRHKLIKDHIDNCHKLLKGSF